MVEPTLGVGQDKDEALGLEHVVAAGVNSRRNWPRLQKWRFDVALRRGTGALEPIEESGYFGETVLGAGSGMDEAKGGAWRQVLSHEVGNIRMRTRNQTTERHHITIGFVCRCERATTFVGSPEQSRFVIDGSDADILGLKVFGHDLEASWKDAVDAVAHEGKDNGTNSKQEIQFDMRCADS